MLKPITFTFTLSETLKYSKDGGFKEANELVLHSPSRTEIKISRKIEQIITQSTLELGNTSPNLIKASSADDDDDAKKKDDDDPEGKQIFIALYASSSSIDIFYNRFQELMCTQCCRINDVDQMDKPIYLKLLPEDEKRLAGQYCAFFLMPSFLKPNDENTTTS